MYIPTTPQVVLSLFGALFSSWNGEHDKGSAAITPAKSIAVIGTGSAGLSAIKALLDLPQDVRADWEIVVYEQRRAPGGIWLPDSHSYNAPHLPESPLYPQLHTNTPVPSMTYPNFPFQPNTPMYPGHAHVQQYHADYARAMGLDEYIHYNHSVVSAAWKGNAANGAWDVVVRVQPEGVEEQKAMEIRRSFDHLLVAHGHFHHPRWIEFPGQEEWLAADQRRSISHSMWYRDGNDYAGRSVLVVGSGSSANDVTTQVSVVAKEIYQSIRTPQDRLGTAPPPVITKPVISHLNATSIVFVDGSAVHTVEAIILGTGYELRVPFLEETGVVTYNRLPPFSPPAESTNTSDNGISPIVTNGRYLHPIHTHIFSLSPSYPTNALAFIGLPIFIYNCPTSTAQSRYAAAAIANASFLPPRPALLDELARTRAHLVELGLDPERQGHKMVDREYAFAYTDGLVERVYDSLGLEVGDGGRTRFTEGWRVELSGFEHLKRGWARVESLGEGEVKRWLDGVESEEEWVDVARKIEVWQAEWEEAQGLVFPKEQTLF